MPFNYRAIFLVITYQKLDDALKRQKPLGSSLMLYRSDGRWCSSVELVNRPCLLPLLLPAFFIFGLVGIAILLYN